MSLGHVLTLTPYGYPSTWLSGRCGDLCINAMDAKAESQKEKSNSKVVQSGRHCLFGRSNFWVRGGRGQHASGRLTNVPL